MLRKYPLVHRFLVPLELRLKRTHEVRYELDRFRPLGESRGGAAVGPSQLAATLVS
jgi:hypothetical protein